MSSSLPKRVKRKKKVGHEATNQLPWLHVSAHMRRLLYVYLACIFVSATVAATLAASQHQATLPDPFSAQQRTIVNFRLYYPAHLPTPYYVDETSLVRLQEGVVSMRITDGSGKGHYFTLSQQRFPDTVNIQALHDSFSDRTTFKTKLGQATTGTIDEGQTRMVSLVTEEKTWIIIQAPISMDLTTLQKSLQALAPSQ